MSNSILFVFEGEKTEEQITNNLTKYFINENTNIQCAFCADVYQLYGKIYNDPDLDMFTILKNRPQNFSILSDFKRNDFAEIYLFFDYDGHAPHARDNIILDLVQFFDEETDAGKIYISYPMIESIKHLSSSIDFENLKVPAKENINYKNLVHTDGTDYLQDLSSLTIENWKEIIEMHLKKMNFIVNDSFSIPFSLITQFAIFRNQLSKYINIDSTIAVLSAFPIFIFDYYGYEKINRLLNDEG